MLGRELFIQHYKELNNASLEAGLFDDGGLEPKELRRVSLFRVNHQQEGKAFITESAAIAAKRHNIEKPIQYRVARGFRRSRIRVTS